MKLCSVIKSDNKSGFISNLSFNLQIWCKGNRLLNCYLIVRYFLSLCTTSNETLNVLELINVYVIIILLMVSKSNNIIILLMYCASKHVLFKMHSLLIPSLPVFLIFSAWGVSPVLSDASCNGLRVTIGSWVTDEKMQNILYRKIKVFQWSTNFT